MVVAIPQILVVGLGNISLPMTRHSLGQLIVDALASRLGIRMAADRALGGYYGHGDVTIGDTIISLSLFKSKSFMNISGPSVAAAYRKTVAAPGSMIVVADSLLHRVETLSVKLGGSPNGHNGVKSVVAALGGEAGFYRFRVGIGRHESDAAEYVLRKLSQHEREFWGNGAGVDLIIDEIEKVARKR